MTCRVRGCTGKTNVQSVSPTAAMIRRRRSGSVFAARWSVRTAYGFSYRDGRAQRDRREQVERVAHHVADDLDPAGVALREKRRA